MAKKLAKKVSKKTAKKVAKKSAKKAVKKVVKKITKAPVKKVAKKVVKKVAKKKARRTVLRSKTGKKLYAVRKADGTFKDIQTYKRAHGMDIKRKSKAEVKAAELAPVTPVVIETPAAPTVAVPTETPTT